MKAWWMLALFAGCAGPAPGTPSTLLVGAPAALSAPFNRIAAAFRARHPGQPLGLTFGSPAELARSGLPFDVIAADAADDLSPFAGRIAAAERRDYASNPLVLVARKGTPAARLQALPVTPWARRLALGDPRVPGSGKAAEAALGRAGVRRALDGKLDYVAGGPEVLAELAAGRAEVGLVFASELAAAPDPHAFSVIDRLPDDPHARYPIAILSSTAHLPEARAFLDETLHGAGPAAFATAGLLPPGALP